MKLYKLTDSNGYTRYSTYWEVGATVSAKDIVSPPRLCTNTVLHAYTSPLLAAVFNRIHADYLNPRCYVVKGVVVVSDGTKVGCRKLEVTGTFELPKLTANQRVAFAIFCVLQVYRDKAYVKWTEDWLSGKDRSANAAKAANAANAAYATYAAYAAANAAYYAANAADAAAKAANAAAAAAANAAKTGRNIIWPTLSDLEPYK